MYNLKNQARAQWRIFCSISLLVNLNLISAIEAAEHLIFNGIVHRDFDSAVQRNIVEEALADGSFNRTTNQFVILENNLHYYENGEWKESEDLIEQLASGAIARRGPNKAIFAPDLNTEAVFDIETRSGVRIRGGVRSIIATDLATGQSVILATVKKEAPSLLVPPNALVYADAFDGLKADVVLVWKHNLFAHDIILQERPILPGEFNPETVQLQIITEFLDAAQSQLKVTWKWCRAL